MLYFKIVARCVGHAKNDRYYDDMEELLEDFYLDEAEVRSLQEGKDIEKSWIKKRWIISIQEPKDE
jgi:hypothetical protein